MPKMKVSDDELNLDELEGAEYNEDDEAQFEPYDGPEPPKNTRLWGYTKWWWTESAKGDRMLKILFVADGSPGKAKQYDGLPIWENVVLTAPVKFKWFPLLRAFGLTIRDVKTKLYLADDDDSVGAPITKIADVKLTEGSDDAYCCVVTTKEKYQDEIQTKVGKWLPWTEPDEASHEAEEPEDKDAGDVEVEEEEAPPARTRGGRRAAAKEPEPEGKPKATRGRSKPAADREEPPASRRGGRRRGGAPVGDDEPPF